MTGHASRGQTLAEFALVVPVLFLLILGLFDIGRLVISYTAITNAAREGARLAVVNQHEPSIQARVLGQTPILVPTTTVEFLETGPNTDAADNDPCSPLKTGCIARVQVEAAIDVITPVIGALIGPLDLVAETQMAVEFVCPASIDGFRLPDDCPKKP